VCAVLLGFCAAARSQSLQVATLAGNPGQGSADGVGASARFANPWGVATDGAGNVYVADTDNHTIRKVSPAGVATTVAGVAGVAGAVDGSGTNALFFQPQGIAVDTATNLYVADTGNQTVRKITPAGVVTTLAGLAGVSGTNNASGSNARFYEPQGIAVNGAGTAIYVADSWNHTIRKVTAAGAVTTLAGVATVPGTNNGVGTGASFNVPQGIAVDGDGNVYVADTGNQMIRKINGGGVVTTLAGSAGNYGTNNGSGGGASFWDPQGVALDSGTNVYVADSMNNTIRKITPAGVVTTLAGVAGAVGSGDGIGVAARFWQPQGVAVDASGSVYVSDGANGTIRKIVTGAVVSTLAGAASIGSADGAGSSARFNGPSGVAIDNAGNSYVADTINGTIRQVTAGGAVTTLAGSAGSYGTNDGSGAGVRFYGPRGITVNGGGSLIYVADTANHTIRKVTAEGAVSTLAGSGGTNGVSDGTGAGAYFNYPQGVAQDGAGNLIVADTRSHTIRRVTAGGVVTTLAGVAGMAGDIDSNMAGNGTNAARFNCPSGVAVDAGGNVYVADTRNHTIRKVTPAGAVSTMAGLGGVWGAADGTNGSARFYLPIGISADGSGNFYVADSGNCTVRKLVISGTNGAVTTVAGAPGIAGSIDATGVYVRMAYPAGLSWNPSGMFALADRGNNTIRSGVALTNLAPVIYSQPSSISVNAGASASFAVMADAVLPLAYQWLFNTAPIPGATGASYTRTNVQNADIGSYSVIVSNTAGAVASSNALLTIKGPPSIITQPASQVVWQGQNAVLSVVATGTQPLVYQWRFNGSDLPGATGSAIVLAPVAAANAGTYSVLITNSAGMAASSNAVLVVTSVALWGNNSFGQSTVPVGAANLIAVAAGAWHNVGLRVDGTVIAWGNNSDGQCNVPTNMQDALSAAAGGYHSLALRANGRVAAWGANDHGQTNVSPAATNVTALAAGTWHSLALRRDGRVAAWGDNGWGQATVPPGLTNVIAISAGGGHNLALLSNRTVVAWGENTDANGNYSGQSVVPLGLTNVVAIAAGKYHSLAVRADGSVVAWGDDTNGQCDVPANLTNVVAVAGGGAHSLALSSDGSIAAWGANGAGQSTVPPGLADIAGVAAGESQSVALAGSTVPVPLLLTPVADGGTFSALAQTLCRAEYALEFKTSLVDAAWTPVTTNRGNGAVGVLVDPAPASPPRYYRMRVW
jgi:sugar lactone lactonase YvrE